LNAEYDDNDLYLILIDEQIFGVQHTM